jgi:hypothetical protein
MFDARLLTRQEWVTLTNSIAAYTHGRVILDLSDLEKTRPFSDFEFRTLPISAS